MNEMDERLMPPAANLGKHADTTMGHVVHIRRCGEFAPMGRRTVMGFILPSWQRPLVWTEQQQVRFLESAWRGLNLGTYTYNMTNDPATDGLLIDGQQRMYAIEQYLADAFPVFGYRWSELSEPDTRRFDMSIKFCCYITETTDEDYLREYYDLMNFGGVAHTEDQRAARKATKESERDG
jgi:hypothetical protein